MPEAAPSQPVAVQALTSGVPVWFHTRDAPKSSNGESTYERPRLAFVLEPGAQPTLVNLLVMALPLNDVANGREPPIYTRRNIAIFNDYPAQWPMEDFAVYPPTAASAYSTPDKSPYGGRRPQIACGRLTIVEGFAPFVPPAPQDDGSGKITPKMRAEIDAADQKKLAELKAEKPPKPPEPKVVKPPPSTAPLDAPLRMLLKHPAWGRSIEELATQPVCEGSEITFKSKAGAVLAVISHRLEGPDMGLNLSVPKTGKKRGLVEVIKAGKTSAAAGKILGFCGRVSVEGAAAVTPAQAMAAVEKIMADTPAD